MASDLGSKLPPQNALYPPIHVAGAPLDVRTVSNGFRFCTPVTISPVPPNNTPKTSIVLVVMSFLVCSFYCGLTLYCVNTCIVLLHFAG